MQTEPDLLQIKIEEAKKKLSEESRQAIDSVPWKTIILSMRAEKGYSFDQLEDLEIETELLLCGLVGVDEYPRELEERMKIQRVEVDALVNEMNEKVFKRIREEFIKNRERDQTHRGEESYKKPEKQFVKSSVMPDTILERLESREELLGKIENLELMPKNKPIIAPATKESAINTVKVSNGKTLHDNEFGANINRESHPILAQKLSEPFKIPTVESDHSIANITKSTEEEKDNLPARVDPYRMPIE